MCERGSISKSSLAESQPVRLMATADERRPIDVAEVAKGAIDSQARKIKGENPIVTVNSSFDSLAYFTLGACYPHCEFC